MGAGASIETTGKIYLEKECGCIYSCAYYESIATEDVGLMKCCYTCLQMLRNEQFDYSYVDRLKLRTSGEPVSRLVNEESGSWMTASRAVQEAHKKGIRTVEEFLYNVNILQRYRRGS